jgi:hypothetical protein
LASSVRAAGASAHSQMGVPAMAFAAVETRKLPRPDNAMKLPTMFAVSYPA